MLTKYTELKNQLIKRERDWKRDIERGEERRYRGRDGERYKRPGMVIFIIVLKVFSNLTHYKFFPNTMTVKVNTIWPFGKREASIDNNFLSLKVLLKWRVPKANNAVATSCADFPFHIILAPKKMQKLILDEKKKIPFLNHCSRFASFGPSNIPDIAFPLKNSNNIEWFLTTYMIMSLKC